MHKSNVQKRNRIKEHLDLTWRTFIKIPGHWIEGGGSKGAHLSDHMVVTGQISVVDTYSSSEV